MLKERSQFGLRVSYLGRFNDLGLLSATALASGQTPDYFLNLHHPALFRLPLCDSLQGGPDQRLWSGLSDNQFYSHPRQERLHKPA